LGGVGLPAPRVVGEDELVVERHADELIGVAFDDEFILTNYPRGG
jgi:hypothetical protein